MTRQPRLWVIDPSVNTPESQGVAEVFHGWNGASRLFEPARVRGDGPGPETGYQTDGVVVLGSAASLHDDDDWIARLAGWLRPILDGEASIPVLGICFGHQLLAGLAGGQVGWIRDDRAKRIGVVDATLDGGRLLPGRHELRVVASHREEVKRRPVGYRTVASRADLAIDGLEHERLPIFSFQFHPEAREDFAGRAGLAHERIDDRVRRDGRRVLGAFQALVSDRRQP